MWLWNEENSRAIFSRSMARNRFTAISRCVRFDDAAACRRTRRADKLAPIRDKCTKHQLIHLLRATFKDLHIENSKNYTR